MKLIVAILFLSIAVAASQASILDGPAASLEQARKAFGSTVSGALSTAITTVSSVAMVGPIGGTLFFTVIEVIALVANILEAPFKLFAQIFE